jgi:hypothetical protein
MFFLLMGVPIAALVVCALIINLVVIPHAPEVTLRQIWMGTGFVQKVAVIVLFLLSLGVQYWALAASSFATQEIWNERSVTIWQALRSVRGKQLRLFWMVLFASILTGPLGLLVFPILAFATAPGFPVAFLEGKSAIAAVKRGGQLLKPKQGKIAILIILWLGAVVLAVLGWFRLLVLLEDWFGLPLPFYLRPVPMFGFWLILLAPQLYFIALTLLYLDCRRLEDVQPIPASP